MRTVDFFMEEDDVPQMIWGHYIPNERGKFDPSKKTKPGPPAKKVSESIPKEWLDAIAFNKRRYTISDKWLIYELGFLAVPMIANIKGRLVSDPNFEIKQINFVTHSMGAATAEGMIEKFMADDVIRPLLEKGQIIHFSAADGDKIVISDNSKKLRRTQLNYYGDKTLRMADGGGAMENIVAWKLSEKDPENAERYKKQVGANRTGGYQIPGVTRFGVVIPDPETVEKGHDWHYDTKTFNAAWKFLEELEEILEDDPSQEGKPVFMEMKDKKWAGPDGPLPASKEKQTT